MFMAAIAIVSFFEKRRPGQEHFVARSIVGLMERHSAIVLETITAIAVVTLVLYVVFGPSD